MSVSARVILSDYTNQVLNVVKAKYSLKDKSAALNRFVAEYATDEVEPELKPSYIKKALKIEKEYLKKGSRRMTKKDLDKLFEKKARKD